MPLYMDIHVVPGATSDALEEAHNADLAVQHKHCVHPIRRRPPPSIARRTA
jgi:hypothetical protein